MTFRSARERTAATWRYLQRCSLKVQRKPGDWVCAVCRDFDLVGIRLYAIGSLRVSVTWPVKPQPRQRRVVYQLAA